MSPDADPCEEESVTRSSVDYPVSGYFIFTSADRCDVLRRTAEARSVGADTLLTFGATLEPVAPEDLRADPAFERFEVDGEDGYDHAVRMTDGGAIRQVYTFEGKKVFHDAALGCGDRNGQVRTRTGVVTWWLFPIEGGYSSCESPSKTYDLVVSHSADDTDADALLVEAAQAHGMAVYLGLPRPQADPPSPYLADDSYTQTLGAFTTRVLADWTARFGKSQAFTGVYQTVETAVFTDEDAWGPISRCTRCSTGSWPRSCRRPNVASS